jgi:hypothetical protein
MQARPTLRALLIRRKLLRWRDIARCPLLDRKCPPARARRNFWRSIKKYPEIAAELGLSEISVYEPY